MTFEEEAKQKVLVTLIIIVSVVILTLSILFLKNYKPGEDFYIINVSFKNVGTLTVGDPVRVSGVKVGKVDGIKLRYKDVLVTLKINSKYKIPDDSKFYVESMGIMGERMISIELGNSENYLDPKKEYSGIYHTGIGEALGSIGFLIDKVDTLLVLVKKVLDSTVAKEEFSNNFSKIIDNLTYTSENLNNILSTNKRRINRIIVNTDKSVRDLRLLLTQLNSKMDNIMNIISNLDTITTDTKELMSSAKSISSSLDSILTYINSGEGTVGKLVKDDSLYYDILELKSKVDSLLYYYLDSKGIKVRLRL